MLGLTTSAARERRVRCLQTIDQRLADERNPQQQPREETAASEAVGSPSASSRYVYCLAKRDAIHSAYNAFNGARGRWEATKIRRNSDDPRYQQALADYQLKLDDLEQLVPEEMRGSMPLIPNAAHLFSTCNREDFFPE